MDIILKPGSTIKRNIKHFCAFAALVTNLICQDPYINTSIDNNNVSGIAEYNANNGKHNADTAEHNADTAEHPQVSHCCGVFPFIHSKTTAHYSELCVKRFLHTCWWQYLVSLQVVNLISIGPTTINKDMHRRCQVDLKQHPCYWKAIMFPPNQNFTVEVKSDLLTLSTN